MFEEMSFTPTHSKRVYLGIIGDVLEGRSNGTEVFVWAIKDFLSLSCQGYYYSTDFRIGEDFWRLVLYPNWTDERWNLASGWLRLGVCRCRGGRPKTFEISLGLKGSRGTEMELQVKWKFSGYGDYFRKNVITRSELIKHRVRLIPAGVLIVTCVVKGIVPPDTGICTSPQLSTEEASCQFSNNQGGAKIQKDFASLLAGGQESDATVRVGDVQFKVHMVLLFARCPALCVAIQHASRKRLINWITVRDCEPSIFEDFLYFLYTGTVRSLSKQTVFSLYRVADKYLVDELKQRCLKHILDILSVQTVCDAMKLALMHRESVLLRKALKFASRNIQQIVASKEWRNFIGECPRDAYDILILFGLRR